MYSSDMEFIALLCRSWRVQPAQMKFISLTICLIVSLAPFGGAVQAHDHASGAAAPRSGVALGRLAVPVACNAAARREFNAGLLYQHSFWHAVAVEHFRAAFAADPRCGMAQWGMALASLDNLFQTPGEAALANASAALRGATGRRARDTAWISALAPLPGAARARSLA